MPALWTGFEKLRDDLCTIDGLLVKDSMEYLWKIQSWGFVWMVAGCPMQMTYARQNRI